MCATSTAKRRRKQARLRKGRKVSKFDRIARMVAQRKR